MSHTKKDTLFSFNFTSGRRGIIPFMMKLIVLGTLLPYFIQLSIPQLFPQSFLHVILLQITMGNRRQGEFKGVRRVEPQISRELVHPRYNHEEESVVDPQPLDKSSTVPDLNVPIAVKKSVGFCTMHPIFNFVS